MLEELFCMLSMRIEIQPHLIERTNKKENNPNKETSEKEKSSMEVRSEKRRKDVNWDCQSSDLIRGGVSRPSLRQRARKR